MKSYEEMSDSVLEKVRIQKAVQRRNRRMVICAASMCCLVLAVCVAANSLKPNTPSIQIEKPTFVEKPVVNLPTSPTDETNDQQASERISIWCASSSGSAEVLRENVSIPYKGELRVRNVSAMTAEERRQVLEEEKDYVSMVLGENPGDGAYSRYCRDNVIVTAITGGAFSIAFDDIEAVSHIQISTTENGYIFYPRFSGIKYKVDDIRNGFSVTVEVDGNSLRKGLAMLELDAFNMVWALNPTVAERLNEKPDADLAQFSDRVTISVTHSDGTVETKTVLIQVCDDGQMAITLVDGTLIEQVPK